MYIGWLSRNQNNSWLELYYFVAKCAQSDSIWVAKAFDIGDIKWYIGIIGFIWSEQ